MRAAALPGLAVGFFDGVHRGHQAILAQAEAALTFRNHPLSVVCPDRAPRLIMSLDARVAAMRECGVREVKVLEFTRELAALEPEVFARRYLSGYRIRCGANWRFGCGGTGGAEMLRTLGWDVETVPFAEWEGQVVSSTRIRKALEDGQMEAASAMLGRPFRVCAARRTGKGEGTRLGFPTVNLMPMQLDLRLPLGVYEVEVANEIAIANFGVAPTFGADAWTTPVLEVHFLRSSVPALNDGPMAVALRRFIRPERTFSSPDELKAQISRDCAAVARDGLAG